MASSVSSPSSATAVDTSSTDLARVPIKTLGQNDFLKLLAVQMSSQDPMNPQKDTDFIAQMAQFSALQTSQDIDSSVSGLVTQQNFSQAYSLLGQTVSLQVDSSNTAQGVVQAVKVNAGTPQLEVNGQDYNLSQVLSVTAAGTQTSGTNTP